MKQQRARFLAYGLAFTAVVIALGFVVHSRSSEAAAPAISFYHWKTVYNPSEEETALSSGTRAGRIYLRLFDVKHQWGTGMLPVATAAFRQKPALPVTPVVYIDNEALSRIYNKRSMPEVGEKIARRVIQMLEGNGLQHTSELQIDCDWTDKTRDHFFILMNSVREHLPPEWIISSTLRLHQFRHPTTTGVPPADRVVLMAYNMGELRRAGDHNSILNASVAATYMKDGYPLPVDLALPLFSWGVVFDEADEYRGLVRELPDSLPSGQTDGNVQWERTGERLWRLKEGDSDTRAIRGMQPGWTLRVEQTTPDELAALATVLAKTVTPQTIVFYHLDETTAQTWKANDLKKIARLFTRGEMLP